MKRYMLDTNTVSHILKQHPEAVRRLLETPMPSVCISAITEGELLFGLAKRPAATRLQLAVRELLLRVDVLPWDRAAAEIYGTVRAALEGKGKSLAPLDMLIAAHALQTDATLVTNDRAFAQVDRLSIEDWTLAA